MKIYSNFKQYYDSALKFMGDTEDGIVYVRKTEEFHLAENSNTVKIERGWNHRFYQYDNFRVLGFCGKLYYFARCGNGWRVVPDEADALFNDIAEHRAKSRYCFTGVSEVEAFCGRNQESKFKSEYHHPFDYSTFFTKYNTPIFLISIGDHFNERWAIFEKKWKVTVNPDLTDYPLQRILDPYIACQEIAMYLANELANTKTPPMPVGSDKVIAESKGFDQWSFRTMPTKKDKK